MMAFVTPKSPAGRAAAPKFKYQCSSNMSTGDLTENTVMDDLSIEDEEEQQRVPVTFDDALLKPRTLIREVTPPLLEDVVPEVQEEKVFAPLQEGPDFFGGSPVIGVFAQPRIHSETEETEYVIAASYVKWVECAGARVLPIPWDAPEEMAREIFSQINGLLFTGGNSILPVAARTLWTLAEQANAKGDFFPIWGTCLGFEYFLMLASGADEFVMEGGYVSHNVSWPVKLTEEDSELYKNRVVREIVTEMPVTMNNHEFGISPAHFRKYPALVEKFRITSVNTDSNGKPFVSTIEPKDPERYPYYGVQFHPEKNAFEYGTHPGTNIPFENINHSADSVYFAFHLASFFVSLARKNLQKGKHHYTDFEGFPLVYCFDCRSGVKFLQFYMVPPVAPKTADGTVRFVGKDFSWKLDDYLADHVGIHKDTYTDE